MSLSRDRPQGWSEGPRADQRRKTSQKLEIQINIQFSLVYDRSLAAQAESYRIVKEPKIEDH
jgi:hypothetical protein